MKQLISQLIKFQSDKNHPQEMKKCFDFVVSDLKKVGLKVNTFQKNGHAALVAAPTLKKHYQFLLNGHLDVVPANYLNAFKPQIKNNRLYGRGASDMKGPLGVLIKISKELVEEKTAVDFCLMITTDEEVGGFDGVNYLVNEKGYSCDCALIPDGGPNFELILGEKGVLFIKLKAKGKAAHGSQPWLGDNALDKLIRVYQQIARKMPKTTKDDNWKPTFNLGVLSGGDAPNKVCALAEAKIDFRYPEKKQRNQLLQLIKEAVKKERRVSFEIIVQGAPLINDPQNKYFKDLQAVASKHGRKLNVKKEHGASDGRFLSEKGIPVLMFKPLCSPAHIKDEWIDLKSLEDYHRIIKDFLLSAI